MADDCTCERDGYPCPAHEADYVAAYAQAAECAARQAELDATLQADERLYEVFLPRVREDAWEVLEDADVPCQGHEWGETRIAADGGDVDAYRVCNRCGLSQQQRLQSEPEPPNCYIPGEGWRVV